MFTLFKGEKGVGESLKVGFVLSADYHSLVGRNLLYDAFGDLRALLLPEGATSLTVSRLKRRMRSRQRGRMSRARRLGGAGMRRIWAGALGYAKISFTIFPWTSVRRKSLPWKR